MSSEGPLPPLCADERSQRAVEAFRQDGLSPEELERVERRLLQPEARPHRRGRRMIVVGLVIVSTAAAARVAVWRYSAAPGHEEAAPAAEAPREVEPTKAAAHAEPNREPPPRVDLHRPPAPKVDPGTPKVDEGTPPAPPPEPRSELLAQQLELYEQAVRQARTGDARGALRRLDELIRQFPSTPLLPEVRFSQATFLAQAGELDAAVPALEALLADPAQAGRRRDLLLVLGDTSLKRGDCTKARAALQQAKQLGVGDDVESRIDAALVRCGP